MPAASHVIWLVCRDNITLSAQRRDPYKVPTHIATWVTIVLPFTKVSLSICARLRICKVQVFAQRQPGLPCRQCVLCVGSALFGWVLHHKKSARFRIMHELQWIGRLMQTLKRRS